jgi:hypothetical protein
VLAHPGVGLDVAGAETDAEPIVIGHVDPGPQVGQPLDAKLHEIDAVDGVAFEGQQPECEVLRFGGDAIRGCDVGPSESDRQRISAQGCGRGREAFPIPIHRDFKFAIGLLRADGHLPATIH